MSVFLWKIEVQVAECQGIAQNPKAEYSLLLRLGIYPLTEAINSLLPLLQDNFILLLQKLASILLFD
jgi:hypothetical protein